ncbi:MAG: response regulator [Acidobacteria bacterium]|nr:response regulator [Acidobacteriota bacterium]
MNSETWRACRILVVDDEKELCELLREFLAERGYEVETATDGISGLEAMERRIPDVVLLDMRMPGLSGLEVLQQIRARHLPVQVIIMTASATSELREQAVALGVAAYLLKPMNLDEMDREIIQGILKKHVLA